MSSRLCTICVRAGSKGVLNKNIKVINGSPLLSYTIMQAKESKLFDLVAVSSDSPEILKIANEFGADILVERPDELATDTAAKIPVIQHCAREASRISGKNFSVVVDMDATSPLRSVDDIIGSVKLLESSGSKNVITGSPSRRSPYFNLVEVGADSVVRLSKSLDKKIVRRQDAPKCFDMNASIYPFTWDGLMNCSGVFLDDTRFFEMPEERSIDIDSELDFEFVEFLMRKNERK